MSLFPFARLLKGGRYKKEVEHRQGECLVVWFRHVGGRSFISIDEVRALFGHLPTFYRRERGKKVIHIDEVADVALGKSWEQSQRRVGDVMVRFRVREWIRCRPRKRPRRRINKGGAHHKIGDVVQFRRG